MTDESYRGYEEEGNPWDELLDPDAPIEASAEERATELDERSVYNATPDEMNPHVLAFMLGAAVNKLGGVLVLTHADRQEWYNVGMDTRELGEDGSGPLRIFSVLQEREV